MKTIEFIKESRPDGSCIYFTQINGYYADGSLKSSEADALAIYNKIVENKGEPIRETVYTTVIEDTNVEETK